MKYLSTAEKAKEWGISNRRVQVLASNGRVKDAQKVGGVWMIPENSTKPTNELSDKLQYYAKTSANRKKLKSLLKESYKFYGKKLTVSEFRCITIAVLNSNILSELINSNVIYQAYEIAANVYKWMGGTNKLKMTVFNDFFFFFQDYVHTVNGDILNIISWSYQYLNDILSDENNEYENTQFFTEQYMIDFLLEDFYKSYNNGLVFDPCCGGGNMLTAIIEVVVEIQNEGTIREKIEIALNKVIGYDIDSKLAYVAILNIKIKCLEILVKNNEKVNFSIWEELIPNIYYSMDKNVVGGLSDKTSMINCLTNTEIEINIFKKSVDVVITNPPFATIKGMNKKLSFFLKKNYPLSNCDICIAFMLRCEQFLTDKGIALMVVQNSWMFLDSFTDFRKAFLNMVSIKKIIDLGSGAFLDLSGEKSNIALISFMKKPSETETIFYSLKNRNIEEKINGIKNYKSDFHVLDQKEIIKNEKARFDILNVGTIRKFYYSERRIADCAVPMQGTSTGNNKELVSYFWKHFNDEEWLLVSKGGGYARWQGLNRYVVKWGETGEYIKKQDGSAIRNAKYFKNTELVFSDTGTSGLNVRLLLQDQIFIASGPGIRINNGNKYSILALLNSRLSSYFIRILSPKLTIAAGYIGKIPINEELVSSTYLAAEAQICINAKKILLMNRPNNIEFSFEIINSLDTQLNEAISQMISKEIRIELQKIEAESDIDKYILKKAKISSRDIKHICKEIGKPTYEYSKNNEISIKEIDKIWTNATDESITLSKNRVNKYMIGSDGIIEYLSHKFSTSPQTIVAIIEKNINECVLIRNKYKNLLFHNYVLLYLGYDVNKGLSIRKVSVDKIVVFMAKHFLINESIIRKWILNEFYDIHSKIFFKLPFLKILMNDKGIWEIAYEK